MATNDLVEALERTTAEAMASGKPLATRLLMIADQVRERSPTFAEAVDRFVAKLKNAEAGAQAPNVGDIMPDFMLPDQAGALVTLEELLRDGPAVIAFLRGHWCPYCRITANALSEIAGEAAAIGGRLAAITPDSGAFIQKLDEDSNGAFPILADIDNGYALSANLAVWVDDGMSCLISGAGWDIPSYQGNEAWLVPIPAMFVVGRDGVVAARHVNPDYRVRADLSEMVAALRRVA